MGLFTYNVYGWHLIRPLALTFVTSNFTAYNIMNSFKKKKFQKPFACNVVVLTVGVYRQAPWWMMLSWPASHGGVLSGINQEGMGKRRLLSFLIDYFKRNLAVCVSVIFSLLQSPMSCHSIYASAMHKLGLQGIFSSG